MTYTYDAGNRLTHLVDSVSGTITRTYDGLDHLTQEVTPQGTVSYTYDAVGRRTSLTVAGQPTINYSYDHANRLTQITQGSSTVTLAYDNAGRRTNVTLPTGNSLASGYDAASHLTSLTYQQGPTTLGTLTYSYDQAGNRTVQGGSWAATGLPQPSGPTSYNANNQVLLFSGATLTYDLNGNVTSATDVTGTATTSWDARNRLTSLSAPGLTATFSYDALGRRVTKTINSAATTFLYDGLNPVQELSGTTPTANLLTGLGIDEYFTRTDSAGTRAMLPDAIGSTRALADNTGAVQTSYTYEPFGYTSTSGVPNSNALQFTGRENDGLQLYYYRARYYSPRLQRFFSEDPLGFRGGDVNLYAYVNQNPVLRNDPSGLIGLPGAAALGCGFGVANGALGARKPVQGASVGGLIGCSLSPLMAELGPGLAVVPGGVPGAVLGAYLGALEGAATAGAGGGDLADMGLNALTGALGGAVGGYFGGVAGAAFGAAIGSGIPYLLSP